LAQIYEETGRHEEAQVALGQVNTLKSASEE